MRKLSILSYIFAGLMLSSCDGYLKEDPRDQLYPEDAYDTPQNVYLNTVCLLYTSPSPRDGATSRMPSSA